jgi:hypothetical protein
MRGVESVAERGENSKRRRAGDGRRAAATILALWSLAGAAAAEVGPRAAARAPERQPLVVHLREGVSLAAAEPDGWRGDADAARHHGVHLIFFPQAPAARTARATIRVRVNPKSDEDTSGDLAAELDGYRGIYPELLAAELSAHHGTYDTVAAVLFRPGLFYEYIAYLNPGPRVPWSVTVALSKPRVPATSSELAAFEAVVRSIAVADDVVERPARMARPPGAGR